MSGSKVYKWAFIDRVGIAVLNLGGNIVLARLLTEADFGLLAMIAIFVAVAADLSSCGLSDGIIHKVNPTREDYSTVFVANTVMGLIFGSAFFFGAPLMASFFHQPELLNITRVLGVCFFFQCMSFTQETYLRKELKMKQMCFVRIGATVSSLGLGITLAVLGYGYWALVCTQLVLSVFFYVYYVAASRWFPGFRFNVRTFKEFFRYGAPLMLAYLGNIVSKNINTSVLGRFYTSALSGVYYQGAKLANVPFSVSESSLNMPFFVVASNEPDPERRRGLILGMMPVIIGFNAILLFFMLVIASPGIELLYGDKWLAAIPVFRILALCEFTVCIKLFSQTICKVYDRTSYVSRIAVVEILAQLGLLALFFDKGILCIAWTQAGGVMISTAVYLFFFARLTELSAVSMAGIFFSVIWLPAVACVSSAATLYALSAVGDFHAVVHCAVAGLVYAGVLVGIGEVFRPTAYMQWRSRIIKKNCK